MIPIFSQTTPFRAVFLRVGHVILLSMVEGDFGMHNGENTLWITISKGDTRSGGGKVVSMGRSVTNWFNGGERKTRLVD